MRRLSTSAIDTIDEHNRLIDRTPLTTPEVALERSFVQAHRGGFHRICITCGTGGNAPLEAKPTEISRVRSKAGMNPVPAALIAIARDRKRFPDPIGSGTFCR